MNTPFTLTLSGIVTAFIAICAGFSTIAAAAGYIIKARAALKAPSQRVEERLAALEKSDKRHDTLFDNDHQRLEALQDGMRILQKSMLALLAHGIDGNDIDRMKQVKAELEDHLINR